MTRRAMRVNETRNFPIPRDRRSKAVRVDTAGHQAVRHDQRETENHRGCRAMEMGEVEL